jgi:hypothetical protein
MKTINLKQKSKPWRSLTIAVAAFAFAFAFVVAGAARAELYAYANEEGDYVITKMLPKGVNEYAVLTDQGEFVKLVQENDIRAPVSHWRPWFLPKEPHPLDGPSIDLPGREPIVEIEEVADRDLDP